MGSEMCIRDRAGILLGFLFYNFPPATTFLGDSGSMLIGLLVGCLAIQSAHSEPMGIALFAPMAIVAVPFFDSFVAILRRRLTGRSIYTVDRGHLHHTLLERGLSPRGMLAVVAVLCSISSLGGVLSIQLNSAWYPSCNQGKFRSSRTSESSCSSANSVMASQRLSQFREPCRRIRCW